LAYLEFSLSLATTTQSIMTQYTTIETALANGVAQIWLNRPDLRNAMNDVLIAELHDAFSNAIEDDDVRVILLAGHGKAFCAGGDLNWMKKAREMSPDEARKDSVRLAEVLRLMYESPKPIVARVHGPAFAGGMGLVSAVDIAVASTDAKFCLSEVKLGLIPAMISPYVIKAMGEPNARRYMLSAEVFGGAEAYRIGFVHELCMPEELDAKVNELLGHLIQASPNAMNETKKLIRDVVGQPIGDAVMNDTAARIARVRASADAQEGIAAFFEKRKASWVPKVNEAAESKAS
jgi:methylglutaconyl-CoA hydratase